MRIPLSIMPVHVQRFLQTDPGKPHCSTLEAIFSSVLGDLMRERTVYQFDYIVFTDNVFKAMISVGQVPVGSSVAIVQTQDGSEESVRFPYNLLDFQEMRHVVSSSLGDEYRDIDMKLGYHSWINQIMEIFQNKTALENKVIHVSPFPLLYAGHKKIPESKWSLCHVSWPDELPETKLSRSPVSLARNHQLWDELRILSGKMRFEKKHVTDVWFIVAQIFRLEGDTRPDTSPETLTEWIEECFKEFEAVKSLVNN